MYKAYLMKYENTFKAIVQILWKEQGFGSELYYLEQKSWMLFLKYLDVLESEREDEAELEGKTYKLKCYVLSTPLNPRLTVSKRILTRFLKSAMH